MFILKWILGKYYDNSYIRVPFELVFVILPIAFTIRTFCFGLYMVPTESMETTFLTGERFLADKFTYWVRPPRHGEIIATDDPRHPYSKNPLVNLWQRYASFNVANWTKRVIGVPGDHLKGLIEDGHPVLYRNGQKLDESSYLNKYPIIGVWNKLPSEQSEQKSSGRLWSYKSFDPQKPWDNQPFYTIDPRLIMTDPHTGNPWSVLYPGTPTPGDTFEVTLGNNQYWVMGDNRLGSGDSREWGVLDGKLIHARIVFRLWSIDSQESWWFMDLIKHPVKFWQNIRWSRCLQVV